MLWLSAKEIADAAAAGLMPGMPTTQRGVNAYADRKRWADTAQARLRGGREGGGGLEYHVDLLPTAAQLAWLGHHLKVSDDDLRLEVVDGPLDPAHDARKVIVQLAEKFRRQLLMSQTAVDTIFCALFNRGSIELPDWIAAEAKSLSPRTLARWRKAIQEGERSARVGRPKGSGILDRADGGEVRSLILGTIARQSFVSARHLRILVKDVYGETLPVADEQTGEIRDVPLPKIRMFQIALAAWKKEYRNELLRLQNPDGWRSKVEFTINDRRHADRLNEEWQIDASPGDVMLTTGRHSIYMAIDTYSRQTTILVSRTARASAVGLLIKKCVTTWDALPERIHTDNGADFVARQTTRLFDSLGIQIVRSAPYNPKPKAKVERAIGTFQRDLAVCPGFIGHSVADRKVIEGRKSFDRRLGATDAELYDVEMDLPAFQAWCDGWASGIYAHNEHEGLGGKTPFAVGAAYQGPVRKLKNLAVLDVLLAPIATGDGLRQVTKQGVRVEGSHYLPYGVMPGTKVLVRMDPADVGRIMLFDPETDDYLGDAICPELAGVSPAAVLAKAKAMQREVQDERSADIKRSMRGTKTRDVAAALMRDGQAKGGALVAFPHRGETHSTPAIDAADDAVSGRLGRAPEARPADPDEARRHSAFVADMAAFQAARRAPTPSETGDDRFRRARALIAQVEAGTVIDEADAAWLAVYRELPEFLGRQMMLDAFPDTARG